MYDVIIVGAGASGCFLALTLKYKNPNLKVALIEKNDKLGKKLLITGNGRCNLGNTNITGLFVSWKMLALMLRKLGLVQGKSVSLK